MEPTSQAISSNVHGRQHQSLVTPLQTLSLVLLISISLWILLHLIQLHIRVNYSTVLSKFRTLRWGIRISTPLGFFCFLYLYKDLSLYSSWPRLFNLSLTAPHHLTLAFSCFFVALFLYRSSLALSYLSALSLIFHYILTGILIVFALKSKYSFVRLQILYNQ